MCSTTRCRLSAFCVLLSLASLLASCSLDDSSPSVELDDLLLPDLSSFEPPVADQLSRAHAAWQRAATEVESQPQNAADAAGGLGRLLHAYGELEGAQVAYFQAAELAPEQPTWPYLRGTLLQEKGDLSAAIEPLKQAVRMAPEDIPSRLRLARSLLAEGRPEEAKVHLQKALELDPRGALAFFLAGQLELRYGAPEAAILAFQRALELQPEADTVHAGIAAAFDALGDSARATEHRNRAGQVQPHTPDPVRAELARLDVSSAAFLRRAQRARQAGDVEAALDLHRRAVEAAPRNAAARSALGAMLAQLGKLDDAISEMRAAQRLGADDPRVIANLAEVHRLRGEHHESAAAHRRVLALDPQSRRSRLGLARALAAEGEAAEAIETYEEVLREEPTNRQASAELESLTRTARGPRTTTTAPSVDLGKAGPR